MDKSTRQQAKAVITGMGTLIACLAFLPLSTRALGQTEPTPARLDQAAASQQPRTLDLQQPHSFNIPFESLNLALTAFSAQSRIHVVTSGVAADVLSPGVKGDVSTLNALTALLHGTGMSFRPVDAETLVVVPEQMARLRPTQFQLVGDALADQPPTTAAAPAAGAPAAPPNALQEVTVSASAISIAGYQAPTPVTAIGIQKLESAAQTNIADALSEQIPSIVGLSADRGNSTGDVSDTLGSLSLMALT